MKKILALSFGLSLLFLSACKSGPSQEEIDAENKRIADSAAAAQQMEQDAQKALMEAAADTAAAPDTASAPADSSAK
jgi:F0F1-type ATP synthase membrane subunit b/b'